MHIRFKSMLSVNPLFSADANRMCIYRWDHMAFVRGKTSRIRRNRPAKAPQCSWVCNADSSPVPPWQRACHPRYIPALPQNLGKPGSFALVAHRIQGRRESFCLLPGKFYIAVFAQGALLRFLSDGYKNPYDSLYTPS